MIHDATLLPAFCRINMLGWLPLKVHAHDRQGSSSTLTFCCDRVRERLVQFQLTRSDCKWLERQRFSRPHFSGFGRRYASVAMFVNIMDNRV